MKRRHLAWGASILTLVVHGIAKASESITYTYDSLGRLVTSTNSGGPNNGTNTAICMDAPGNRSAYVTYLSGTATCTNPTTPSAPTPPTPPPPPPPPPTPPAPPPPPPPPSAPVAVADAVSVRCNLTKTVDLLANDYDPNGHTPLTLSSATGGVMVSSTTLQVTGEPTAGTSYITYTITNSVLGSASSTLTVTTTGTYEQCVGP